jgi:hypothetical protein
MSSDNGSNNPSSTDTISNTTAKFSTPSGASNKRILIVDDEEDIAWCFTNRDPGPGYWKKPEW